MHLKLRIIVLSVLLICLPSAKAEDIPPKQECQPPAPTKSRPSPQVVREVNVACGANSITQTFATPPASSASSLHQSVGNASPSSSTLVALIAAAAGVLGALAGGLASYLVARVKARSDLELETKRLQANLVATERLRWLQDIRQRLSTLYQRLDSQYSLLQRPVAPGHGPTTQKQLDEMSSEVMGQCNMITLMLNPAKPDQAALHNALQSALSFMQSVFHQAAAGVKSFNDAQYASYKQAAFDAMTRLGVDTWKQVKSLS